MPTIEADDAQTALLRPTDHALAGEEIVIARKGRPVVRLVPVGEELPPREPGALKGVFEVPDSFFEPLPDDILDAFVGNTASGDR